MSSYRLDQRFNPCSLDTPPDGRAVFLTSRRGLMVTTGPSNSSFEFRPGPVRPGDLVAIARDTLIRTLGPAAHTVHVSADAGNTWRTIDLEAGGW